MVSRDPPGRDDDGVGCVRSGDESEEGTAESDPGHADDHGGGPGVTEVLGGAGRAPEHGGDDDE